MNYRIFPPEELLETRVKLPLSKSLSNRALIINALTPGALPLGEIADCDDTRVTSEALASDADCINVGAAGTAMRFLTAYFASSPGRTVTLDGSERMRHRPIAALVDALRQCGAEISYAGEEGYPPIRIAGSRLAGGSITVPASISSQYISALMMVAPLMTEGLTIHLEGEIISRPYILMTLAMMKEWGAEGELEGNRLTLEPGIYRPVEFAVEADWSAASYWYELEALTSGWITLDGLRSDSLQGDKAVSRIFNNLGVVTEWEGEDGGTDLVASPDLSPRLTIDMTDTPDLAQTVIVTCAMLGIPFRITGLASLRIKETDRLEALRKEILKIGIILRIENSDTMEWEGERRPITEMPEFDTYEDHRMAMALAPVSVYVPGIVIRDVEVVSKSYPTFWDDLRNAGFTLTETSVENGKEE